jgi:hypothetical protein
VLADAENIVNVWSTNSDFKLGEITLPKFKEASANLQEADSTVEAKRTELTALIIDRDSQAAALNEWVSRARSGFRAVYGPDSTQYQQAGGTRASERRKPVRRGSAPEQKAA